MTTGEVSNLDKRRGTEQCRGGRERRARAHGPSEREIQEDDRSSVPRVQGVASEVDPILGLELAEVGEFGVLLLTVTTPVNAANDREGLPPLLPFDIVELFGVGVVLGDFIDPHGESSPGRVDAQGGTGFSSHFAIFPLHTPTASRTPCNSIHSRMLSFSTGRSPLRS